MSPPPPPSSGSLWPASPCDVQAEITGSTWAFSVLQFSTTGRSPVANFFTVVWKCPVFPCSLEAWCRPCESWDLMSHCHPAQPLLTHPLSALLVSASLFFLGKASCLFLSPLFFPASFLEPIFLIHFTPAFPLLSPQLFCCRQASKKKKKNTLENSFSNFCPVSFLSPSAKPYCCCPAKQRPHFLSWWREGSSFSGGSLLTLGLTGPPLSGPSRPGLRLLHKHTPGLGSRCCIY